MDEKILRVLRGHPDSFFSIDQLNKKTSIPKAIIARCIHRLQREGYDIQVQPHFGYKLIAPPDRLLAQEVGWQLNTRIIGQKIFSYDTVDSTNTVAFALAEKGASEGTSVFAEAQTEGRGRLGRSWVSPGLGGIYLSIVLRPKILPEKAALVTLLAAVSCAETIRKICGLQALIRWPNDILVNSRKVCGILTEMELKDKKIKFVILGIGINVNTPISKLPAGASSLREEAGRRKTQFSRLELARELLRRLDEEYLYFGDRGSARLIDRWKNLSALSGRRIKVFLTDRTVEGQAQDIDEQGALIVRLDNGFKQHIVAGDVVKVR